MNKIPSCLFGAPDQSILLTKRGSHRQRHRWRPINQKICTMINRCIYSVHSVGCSAFAAPTATSVPKLYFHISASLPRPGPLPDLPPRPSSSNSYINSKLECALMRSNKKAHGTGNTQTIVTTSRRVLLKNTGIAALGLAVAPGLLMSRIAEADTRKPGNVPRSAVQQLPLLYPGLHVERDRALHHRRRQGQSTWLVQCMGREKQLIKQPAP